MTTAAEGSALAPADPQAAMVADQERATRAAETLFGSDETAVSSYAPRLMDSADAAADRVGLSGAEHGALLHELSTTFRDAGINATLGDTIGTQLLARIGNPADAATVQEWNQEARRIVREQYGFAEGDRRLKLARDFIAARPALAKRLTETGVGSFPALVVALAENAHNLRPPRK